MAKTPSRKQPKACSMGQSNPTPNLGGQPTKYKPEYCQRILELAKEGCSVAEMSSNLGVCRDTYYEWIKAHPEFEKAAKEATSHACAWWEMVGRECAAGRRKGDAKIWSIMMKNKFHYRDNPHPEDQSTREGVVDEIARRVALIQEREKPI